MIKFRVTLRSQGRFIQDSQVRTSPAVLWLGLHASTTCSIPGRGSKTPHVTLRSQKKKKGLQVSWLFGEASSRIAPEEQGGS